MVKLKWLLVVVLLSACTPEQLGSLESRYDIDLVPHVETWALAQPDEPIRMMDGTVIAVDGSVTEPVGLDAALQQAIGLNCDSWRPVYDWFVANATRRAPSWREWRRVLNRESGCGWDTFNERTRDSGPMQVNPVHRRWIADELGIEFHTVRQWREGMLAAIALFNKTGWCNWQPPEFCSS